MGQRLPRTRPKKATNVGKKDTKVKEMPKAMLDNASVELFFVLNWDLRQANITDERPPGSEVHGRFKWRGRGSPVTLVSIKFPTESGPIRQVSTWRYRDGASNLLKSNLQKAIRRGETDIAVKTAEALGRTDPNSLVQRLAIITIEDVGPLVSEVGILTWMLAFEQLRKPVPEDVLTWILRFVAAASEYRPEEVRPWANETEPVSVMNFPLLQDRCDLLSTILIRAENRCLKGDKRMLERLVSFFFRQTDLKLPEALKLGPPQPSFSTLSEEEVLTAAVDDHCCKQVVAKTSMKLGINRDLVSRTLWTRSGSVNIRTACEGAGELEEDTEDRWEQIEAVHHVLAREYIQTLYKT